MFSPVALYVVGIMSGVVSLLVLGSLLRASIPGLARWIVAHAMIILAFLVLAVCRIPPAPVCVTISTLLLGGAAFVVLQGVRQFFGLCAARTPDYVVWALFAAGIVYWTCIDRDMNARMVTMSAFLAIVRLAVAWIAFRMRPRHRPVYSYYFVAAVAAVGGLIHLSRALAIGLGWEHHTGFLQDTVSNVAFLAMGIVTLPCLSIGVVMLAYDRMAERMERLATIDELTGTLVRRAFMAQAEARLRQASQTGAGLAVAILDIDNFKAVNDNHGHAAGDRALAHFSRIVEQGLRPGDIFGRLGGEEFAVLFPGATAEGAVALVDRLRLRVAGSALPGDDGPISFTFSGGVDQYYRGEVLAGLMARADAALYSAKAMGRNRVVSAISGCTPLIEHIDSTLGHA
jgi:diguanylate cyclase (GGDEF)-like protein